MGAGPLTTAALLEEIASLREQNEEQRRELEQLRGAVPLPIRPSNSPEAFPPTTMHRFNDFPVEVREMIWKYALPKRLVGNGDIDEKSRVPMYLSCPALAHVCQESRSFVRRKNHNNALPGESGLPEHDHEKSRRSKGQWDRSDPIPARWAWFSPSLDALMVNNSWFHGYWRDGNLVLARAAEHIIVEDYVDHRSFWDSYLPLFRDHTQGARDRFLEDFTRWVRKVSETPRSGVEKCDHTRGPICSLRRLDFSMGGMTQIDPRSCPSQLIQRLFGDNSFRTVDLRDTEPVDILRMLSHELSGGTYQELFSRSSRGLEWSMNIYEYAAEAFSNYFKPLFLKALVSVCFEASKKECPGGLETLPVPFKSGDRMYKSELDMDVTWVKELSGRLTIRPVHVFVLAKDLSEDLSEN